MDTVIVPQFNAEGVTERFVSIRTDITRLKAVEADLPGLTHELDERVDQWMAELERPRAEVDTLNRELEARVDQRTSQLEAASSQFKLLLNTAP